MSKTIPELADRHAELRLAFYSVLIDYCELEYTAQIVAMLAVQANSDQNISLLSKAQMSKLEEVEDLLIKAARLYDEVADEQKRQE